MNLFLLFNCNIFNLTLKIIIIKMDNQYIKEEIKILKIGYIIHFLFFLLLLIAHLTIYIKSYWLSKYINHIIFAEIIIISIFSLLPIILLVFISCTKLSEKIIKKLGIISMIFLFIFIINSLFTSISICYNTLLTETFYKNCPYNFNYTDIPNIFINYQIDNKEQIKKKCNYRKCFPINYNNSFYICNFKEKDEKANYSELFISILDTENLIKEVIEYINYCRYFTIFYKKEKKSFIYYDISYNFICPNSSDLVINYILTFFFIFADIFASTLSWLYEYYSYKKILLILEYQRYSNNNVNISIKETSNTSHIDGNNINQNNNNNDEDHNNNENFVKQPTDLLIIDNNKIINISKENKEERIINILNKEKGNNEITNDVDAINNNINNNKNNNDKSEENLMKNINIFKVINNPRNQDSNKKEKE